LNTTVEGAPAVAAVPACTVVLHRRLTTLTGVVGRSAGAGIGDVLGYGVGVGAVVGAGAGAGVGVGVGLDVDATVTVLVAFAVPAGPAHVIV
jgi:hypothetical protein